ncbi:MAG: hypothetical protein PHW73_05185 [Atribacterota bacterium]|nr:hypothetical protein [Atribacterota bacterium]
MKQKWIGTQVVLINKPDHNLYKNDNLKRKLATAKESLESDALMVWPDLNKKNLDLVREICRDFKIKTYLWTPVLADILCFKIEQEQAVETFDRLHGFGRNGCWDKLGKGEEDFLFLCPNDEEHMKPILDQYQSTIKESEFDGVFLDRIRFPSPSNGFEALFSCFCKYCLNKFYTKYSEGLENYRYQVKAVFEKFKTIDISYLRTCQSLSDIIIQENLKKFYDFRKQNIYQVVKIFADKAKQMGKLVGVDLFAPSLAPLVSQDYWLLAKTCDWIKPMIYGHASVPAGLPLELYCFMKAILNMNPALDEGQLTREISRIIGVDLPTQINDLLKNGVSEKIICSEMQRIKELDLTESVNIYVGLEAVQIPGLCNITAKILKKYLKSVTEAEVKGIILSWDLLKIPDENLKIVGDFLSKQP